MSLPPSYNLLAKHLNPVYIETGIYRGDSLRLAIDAGFKRVAGIEYFKEHIEFCKSRFRMASRRQIVDGTDLSLIESDSATELGAAIFFIANGEPVTFFLDAHSQYLENEVETENPYPLMYELLQIKEHANPKSTIIIDDWLHLTHPDVPTGFTKDEIILMLKLINPDYKISYIANPVRNNLMICTP